MYNQTISLIAGGFTLGFMVTSYLFKSKRMYLLFQALGLVCMFISYLFIHEFFAMIALTVSLSRTVTFFWYENKNKSAPVALAFLFAALTVCAFGVVNIIILKTAKPLDILYLCAQVMYSFMFRIRDIKLFRNLVIIPHVLAIAYNVLLRNAPFVAASYGFELVADVYAIVRQRFTKGEKA